MPYLPDRPMERYNHSKISTLEHFCSSGFLWSSCGKHTHTSVFKLCYTVVHYYSYYIFLILLYSNIYVVILITFSYHVSLNLSTGV